jgi:hypothetical protein
MEDGLLELLGQKGVGDGLSKESARAKLINQDLANTTGGADYTQDPDEMRKQGKIWDGYRWV